MLKKTLLFLIVFFVTAASVSGLERRRDQFTTDFGYLVAPIPYILPGAGAGFGLLGAFNNIPFGSTETSSSTFNYRYKKLDLGIGKETVMEYGLKLILLVINQYLRKKKEIVLTDYLAFMLSN